VNHLSSEDIGFIAAQLQSQAFGVLAASRQRQGEELERGLAELQNIEDALGRLADGSYGACASCRAPIALRRLRAQPAARLCLTCQANFEQHRHLGPAPAKPK
jgi:RNA polymerase-binding transcription factor DksA